MHPLTTDAENLSPTTWQVVTFEVMKLEAYDDTRGQLVHGLEIAKSHVSTELSPTLEQCLSDLSDCAVLHYFHHGLE